MVAFREVSTIAKLRDHKEGILLQPRQPFQPLHLLPATVLFILQGRHLGKHFLIQPEILSDI